MSKKEISCVSAPSAIGPYSQGIAAAGITFVSGQLGIDVASGELAEGVEEQARNSLKNIGEILGAAEYFSAPCPARSCVEVSALPKGGLVEIEAIAIG